MQRFSSVVRDLPSSGIRKIFEKVSALEKQGEKFIRLDIGRPDLPTPDFIVDASLKALREGFTQYVGNRGIPELLEAISKKLKTENKVTYNPSSEILVTTGASEGVAVAMLGILEPGAEVLVPQPAWPHYVNCARLAGAKVVPVPLKVENGFQLTSEILEQYATPATRLLVLNSPQNPTGLTYSESTLIDVLSFAKSRGIYILSDEMYEDFQFDNVVPSLSTLPNARDITILVNGFSKAFGMTGWRLGWIAAPEELITQLNKVHQYLTVCATSFAQKGAVQAYSNPESTAFRRQVQKLFQKRRDALLDELESTNIFQYCRPSGAFYFFPRVPMGKLKSEEFALKLLAEAKIATVPGVVFGDQYDSFLRISYGNCSEEDLRFGIRRLIEFTQSENRYQGKA